MDTYLLTWNPNNWQWDDLELHANLTREGQLVSEPWSTGNTKRIMAGDRLFLLKQGQQPKGLIASGWTTSGVEVGRHWDEAKARRGETALSVEADWDAILNFESEPLLPATAFQHEGLPTLHWNTQSSGIHVPPDLAAEMEVLWTRHVEATRGVGFDLAADDWSADEFPEGKVLYRLHRSYERSAELRHRKKLLGLRENNGRLLCEVCGFDFFEVYGELGKHFIECHHTVPVSQLQPGIKTKLADLVLVCANCHRMLHRKRPWPHSVTELRRLIAR